jgi:hypothetical protein
MGAENFNRQFVLIDFRDLDDPEFLALVRSPEFSTYLLMRRHIWRSLQPHHMGLHELYGRDRLLTCSLDREQMADQLGGVTTRTVSRDLVALERRGLIRVRGTGRQNIYVLGWWGKEEGVHYEVFYADRLQVRDDVFFTPDLKRQTLQVRPEENVISEMKLNSTSEVKKSSPNNREENRERKREKVEDSKIRKDDPALVDKYDDTRLSLLPYVEDFARELNDRAPLGASVSRVVGIYERSGLSLDEFTQALYRARAITKERQAAIRAAPAGDDPWRKKPKMAYYLAVLEDLTTRHVDASTEPNGAKANRQ